MKHKIVADRVINTIKAMKSYNGITVNELKEILECSYSTAFRYVQAITLYLPVIALNEWNRSYHESFRYRIDPKWFREC